MRMLLCSLNVNHENNCIFCLDLIIFIVYTGIICLYSYVPANVFIWPTIYALRQRNIIYIMGYFRIQKVIQLKTFKKYKSVKKREQTNSLWKNTFQTDRGSQIGAILGFIKEVKIYGNPGIFQLKVNLLSRMQGFRVSDCSETDGCTKYNLRYCI